MSQHKREAPNDAEQNKFLKNGLIILEDYRLYLLSTASPSWTPRSAYCRRRDRSDSGSASCEAGATSSSSAPRSPRPPTAVLGVGQVIDESRASLCRPATWTSTSSTGRASRWTFRGHDGSAQRHVVTQGNACATWAAATSRPGCWPTATLVAQRKRIGRRWSATRSRIT